MSEDDKLISPSVVHTMSDVNGDDNVPSIVTAEFLIPTGTAALEHGILCNGGPLIEQVNAISEEPLVLDLPSADNITDGSYFPNNMLDMDSIDKLFPQGDQSIQSPTTEKVFEVPLLVNNHYSGSGEFEVNKTEIHCEQQICQEADIGDNDVNKEETNSDSTVEYSLDEVEGIHINSIGDGTSVEQSFSPLPSTSRDYVTMNINDIRFNKVIGTSHSEIKEELQVVKAEEKNPQLEINTNKVIIQDLSIIECSSGSDNADDEVMICGETKPNIIDLSNDDNNSDCEIIDVDDILSENEKVLNVTQISQAATPRMHNTNSVVNLSDSVEIMSPSVEIVTPNMDLLPVPLPERSEISATVDNHQIHNHTPPPDNYYPLFSELKTILNYLTDGKPVDQNRMQNVYSDPENIYHNTFNDNIMPPYPHPSTDSHRRKSRRIDNMSRKRRRLEPVIDLSVTSTIKPNSSSDVIVIDVDSPVSIQRTNNVAQISVSIVGPTHISTSVESHVPVPPRNILNGSSTEQSNVTVTSGSVPIRESSSETPPRRLGDCPVCLENFSKVKAVSTFCGHLFCIGCITKVKTTSKKCPTCRNQLKGKGYHPIFL